MRRILFICISMLVTSIPACAQSVIKLARIAEMDASGELVRLRDALVKQTLSEP